MGPPRSADADFVWYLRELARHEDRAGLAALRRGLGKEPGETVEMYRYVERFLGPESGQEEQDAYYLVAALFAAHQGTWSPDGEKRNATNLGASFARLAQLTESGSIEHRFVALLNCRREDLSPHLRHAVSLLKAHEVPVDWLQLLRDVRNWERANRGVQRAWASAFWGSAVPDSEPATSQAAAEPEETDGAGIENE